jgi:hypothetical protein
MMMRFDDASLGFSSYRQCITMTSMPLGDELSPVHCASGAVIGLGELDPVMTEPSAIEAFVVCLGNTGF